jgi:hypothetical protein
MNFTDFCTAVINTNNKSLPPIPYKWTQNIKKIKSIKKIISVPLGLKRK